MFKRHLTKYTPELKHPAKSGRRTFEWVSMPSRLFQRLRADEVANIAPPIRTEPRESNLERLRRLKSEDKHYRATHRK